MLVVRFICFNSKNEFYYYNNNVISDNISIILFLIFFHTITDIIIGAPSTTPGNLMAKIHEERTKYLIAELDIEPSLKEEWSAFCEFVKEKCDQLGIDKFKVGAFSDRLIQRKQN